MIAFSPAILGLQWDRPWAMGWLPLVALAWWLLAAARRPRMRFTGAHGLWPATPDSRVSRARRGFWPTRLWELLALVLALFALAGPGPQTSEDPSVVTVVVDRSPSMYLESDTDANRTRLSQALRELESWSLRGALQFLDPGGGGSRVFASWPGAWDLAPPDIRAPVDWSEWDRPGHLWLTDDRPASDPVAASLLAVGGKFQPGPVARVEKGVLVQDATGAIVLEARPALPVLGGAQWIGPWAQYAKLWCADRGLLWNPSGDSWGPLQLVVPEEVTADSSVSFDWESSGYRLHGRCAISQDSDGEGWNPGPWTFSHDGKSVNLLEWRPGSVRLRVTEWQEVNGDVAAFVVDLARVLDGACLLPPDVVAESERRAVMRAVLRAGDMAQQNRSHRPNSSPWAPWLAVAATLCLLASFGSGFSRRVRGR